MKTRKDDTKEENGQESVHSILSKLNKAQLLALVDLVDDSDNQQSKARSHRDSRLPSMNQLIFGITSVVGLYALYKLFGNPSEEEVGEIEESIQETKDAVPTKDVPKVEVDKPQEVKKAEPGEWSKLTSFFKSLFSGPPPDVTKPATGGVTPTPPGAVQVTPAVKPKSLSSGYRDQYDFPPELKNSKSLSKNGSYTEEEYQRILSLKSAGANTSAAYTMPKSISDLIQARAVAYGLDPIEMVKVAKMESGGNPDAVSSTGAIGIFQLVGSTATKLGVKNRFDATQNIEAGMQLAAENSKRFKDKGLDSSPLALYLAHQIGPTSAQEVLAAAKADKYISQLSKSTQNKINKNVGSKSSKVREYIEANQSKLNSFQVEPVSFNIASESSSSSSTTVARVDLDRIPEPSSVVKPGQSVLIPQENNQNYVRSNPGSSKDPSGVNPQPAQPPQSVANGPGGIILGT